ncbi:MAG TPA: MFS transporter [Candidatus Binatia bacterium]|nr:MFS transporter [Candidatus Binatia bacterium]
MSFNVFFNLLSDVYYGWRMVGLVSIIRIVGGGLHQFGFTVFFLPISQDLGISRAATSLAFSLSRAQGAIEAPLVGYLIDRYGPRPIMVAAVFLAGLGYILLSWADSYASFMIVYLGVISLAFVAGFVHSPMVVANSWFIHQRARAMTVVSAAVPVGGALISPLLAIGVSSIGWRWAAFLSGCVFLLVCLPLSFQLKRSPESMGLLPDGKATALNEGADSSISSADGNANGDLTSRQAMKTWMFWVLVTAMTARVTCYSAATVHFIPLMVWKGMSESAAASLLGIFAVVNLVAHFVLGWIADRVNKPKLLAACHLLPAVSVVPLLFDSADYQLWLFAIGFTLLDASFPIVWATVGDFFGRRHFATIRGMMSFFYMWGSFAGPVLAGVIYDKTQTYWIVLWIFLTLLIVATLLVFSLIRVWTIRMMATGSPVASRATTA